MTEHILIVDFGAQYTQLIARRVREAGAFSLLVSPTIPAAELAAMNPKGTPISTAKNTVLTRSQASSAAVIGTLAATGFPLPVVADDETGANAIVLRRDAGAEGGGARPGGQRRPPGGGSHPDRESRRGHWPGQELDFSRSATRKAPGRPYAVSVAGCEQQRQ